MAGKTSVSAAYKNARGKFINPAQLGGIELATIADGPGRGTRTAWVNTGTPLRYKVVIDRGMDIADCFYGLHSLCFLTYGGISAPSPARDIGLEWLKGFFSGMLTSCGPQHAGGPAKINGVEYGIHGTHSNTPAELELICQPEPADHVYAMSITGTVRTARLFGPNIELRRTIRSVLGEPAFHVHDCFINRGNAPTRHCWLMHFNFGYPLLDEGSVVVYRGQVSPRKGCEEWFGKRNYKVAPAPTARHSGAGEDVAFIDVQPDRQGLCHVGVVNKRLNLGVEISYAKSSFPVLVNWQHFGANEYVLGLEPLAGCMEGHGQELMLLPGQRREYTCTLRVLADRQPLKELVARFG
jgi:hypothetical protein